MATTAVTTSELILAPEQEVDTPCLVVDETILRRNIERMKVFADRVGVGLRPHIKTHKTPEIARMQLAAGAIGITCAKVGEAEVMVEQAGVTDILLAYPTVGEPKIRRIVALLERARIVVAVDSAAAAEALSSAMTRHGRTLEVCVEVNTGQNRSGTLAGDEALAFALAVAKLPGLSLTGIMTHEGQANSAPPEQLETLALAAGRAMFELAELIRGHGLDLPMVSVGSTPAATYTPTVSGITEMRPGTYVFNDNSAFRYGELGVADCAARFVATVVSRPAADRAVLDTGSKSLAMDPSKGHPGHGYIVGYPEAIISKLSEEHGVVTLPEGASGFAVGDRVEVIPNHICPTVNLMDELFIARDGRIVDTWRIAARG